MKYVIGDRLVVRATGATVIVVSTWSRERRYLVWTGTTHEWRGEEELEPRRTEGHPGDGVARLLLWRILMVWPGRPGRSEETTMKLHLAPQATREQEQAWAELRAINWKATTWGAKGKLNRNTGRIGPQMRGVSVLLDGGVLLWSADQIVGYRPFGGQLIITSKRFELPDAVLDARDSLSSSGHRFRIGRRQGPTYSMTTERHKKWFYWEFDGVGDYKPAFVDGDTFDRTIGRLNLTAESKRDFTKTSRYEF